MSKEPEYKLAKEMLSRATSIIADAASAHGKLQRDIGGNMKRTRLAADVSLAQMAQHTNLSINCLEDLESGERPWTDNYIDCYRACLGAYQELREQCQPGRLTLKYNRAHTLWQMRVMDAATNNDRCNGEALIRQMYDLVDSADCVLGRWSCPGRTVTLKLK